MQNLVRAIDGDRAAAARGLRIAIEPLGATGLDRIIEKLRLVEATSAALATDKYIQMIAYGSPVGYRDA